MKCGKTPFEERGVCENPVRLSMCHGPMQTVKYMCVNIWCMLDCIVGLAQLLSAQNETLLWLAGMNYEKIQTHCKG